MFILLVFLAGYLLITLEHPLKLNKAATALLTGVVCWAIYSLGGADGGHVTEQLIGHLGEIAGILFFLLGAMAIVELIDAHDGFELITSVIRTLNKRKLMWILCFLTFFLSAVLDNLATTIVMISLLRKLVDDKEDRLLFSGMIIISANSGGAWSPIGDVTTTMLWIGGFITAQRTVLGLFLPSLVSMLVPLVLLSLRMRGEVQRPVIDIDEYKPTATRFARNVIFFAGLGMLLFVPVFKTITHLPPFMGVMLGLGVLWVLSEFLHHEKDQNIKNEFSVMHALRRIDMPSVLFFLGILLAVSALQSTGQLAAMAGVIAENVQDIRVLVMSIGLLSAIVDNVPLVAAAMQMYGLEAYPVDHYFWQFLAYCAGTGGSVLIIGSAAGVAAMGIEKISFIDYLKRISWLALLGYFAGAGVFILMN